MSVFLAQKQTMIANINSHLVFVFCDEVARARKTFTCSDSSELDICSAVLTECSLRFLCTE